MSEPPNYRCLNCDNCKHIGGPYLQFSMHEAYCIKYENKVINPERGICDDYEEA